jgi:hypothetical protein
VQVHVEHGLGGQRPDVDVAQRLEEVGPERERPGWLRLGVHRRLVEVESQLGIGLGVRCVGVLDEEGEQLSGPGEPGEGEGAELVGVGLGVERGDDLRDAVHDGVDGGGVAGL